MKALQKNKRVVVSLVIWCALVVFLVASVVYFNWTNQKYLPKVTDESLPSDYVIPSQLLNKSGLSGGMGIKVRGKVYQEAVVCTKMACDPGSQCCGCPETRELLVDDPRPNGSEKGITQIRLTNGQGSTLCVKKADSCDYRCEGDWQIGKVYDIQGVFGDQSGNTVGIKFLSNYSFRVTNKTLVGGFGMVQVINEAVMGVVQAVQGWRTSGEYVIL